MALHPVFIHFPIGMIYLAAIANTIGIISVVLKKKLKSDKSEVIKEITSTDTGNKLDFVINISLVIGLLGIIMTMYTGLIDASFGSETDLPQLFEFWLIPQGIMNALSVKILTIKLFWATISTLFIIFALYLRKYLLRVNDVNSIFKTDTNSLFSFSLLIYTTMSLITIIGGYGGIYVYGHTILQDIPIIQLFFQYDQLIIVFVLMVLFIEIISLSRVSKHKVHFATHTD